MWRAKTKKTLKARLAKKALDVRSSFNHGSGSKTPAGMDTPQARPSSSVAIEVYPDTPKRVPALSSDPLLATRLDRLFVFLRPALLAEVVLSDLILIFRHAHADVVLPDRAGIA